MSEAENNYWSHQCQCTSCEEYRDQNQRKWDAVVIKAFVERVDQRIEAQCGLNRGVYTYREALQEELAAMEGMTVTEGTASVHSPRQNILSDEQLKQVENYLKAKYGLE